MRAVVFATGYNEDFKFSSDRYAGSLITLVDRPFIQHVVEYLAACGVTEIDLVLSECAESFEKLLGDGSRWGVQFRFHLAREPKLPYRVLQVMDFPEAEQKVLFVHGDRLPRVDLNGVMGPCSFVSKAEDGQCVWSGWALVDGKFIADLVDDMDEEALNDCINQSVASGVLARQEVSVMLGVHSAEALLASHWTVLNGEFPGLLLTGREADPGIWLCRNVAIHPTARIVPPVYIGDNCRIEHGVQLGPHAVVGQDCMIDRRASVQDSVVLKGTYVGEELELEGAIVDHNRLYNVGFGAALTVTDNFILSSLEERNLQPFMQGVFRWLVAGGLLVLFAPLLLLLIVGLKLFRKGPVFYCRDVVRLPAADDDHLWRTFKLYSFVPFDKASSGSMTRWLLSFLPALVSVARRDLFFVGVQPRTTQEISALPDDWRNLYLSTKAGLISEAQIVYGDNPSEDELYAAEAFYAVSNGFKHDARLVWGAVKRLLLGSGRRND